MKKIWESGIILFAVMGFWGMIYPDLCFTQDVCRVVYENTNVAEETNISKEICEESTKDTFTQICEAEAGQLRVRSRLFDYFTGDEASEELENNNTPALQTAEKRENINRKQREK